MERRARVLFVDDDDNILRALRRVFRQEAWELGFARSGDEALTRFEVDGVWDVVVADQRMPGMSGVALLRALRERHPRTVRVMLSSHTDTDTVLDAINEGFAYKFLVKTCTEDALRETLRDVVAGVELRLENQRLAGKVAAQGAEISAIDRLVEELETMPPPGLDPAEEGSALLALAVGVAPVGLAVWGGEPPATFANPAARRLLGLEAHGPLEAAELTRRLAAAGELECRRAPLPDDREVAVFWQP